MEYVYKQIPEDFLVTEMLDIHIKPIGKVKYYMLIKKGISTFDAIGLLEQENAVKSKIYFAGLKDEDGVTTQYISLDNDENFNDCYIEIDGGFINVTLIGYGDKHISTKDLFGNGFSINVRNLDNIIHDKIDYKKKRLLFINYYDEQRFGRVGNKHVTHLLGKAIYDNDKNLVNKYLSLGGQKKDYDELMNVKNIREKSFCLNSWKSYEWNKEVMKSLLTRDILVKKFRSGEFEFLYTDQSNLRQSVSWDYPMEQFIACDKEITIIKNTREWIKPVLIYIDNICDDELNRGKFKLSMHFNLDKGTYATMAIKQFFLEVDAHN